MKALMYHYVRHDSDLFPYSAHKRTEDFLLEIRLLKSLGYTFSNPSSCLAQERCNSEEFDDKSIILTFDDGLKDHLNVARILKEHGIERAVFYIPVEPYLYGKVLAVHKAQFIRSKFGAASLELLEEAARHLDIDLLKHFTITDHLDKFRHTYSDDTDDLRTKHFKRLINYFGDLGLRTCLLDKILELSGLHLSFEDFYLHESEILQIVNMGFEIGSHGLSHTPLSRLGPISQKTELCESKAFLEQLTSVEVRSFCYPYGGKESYDKLTLRLLSESGYDNAVSVNFRDITIHDILETPYEIPRYDCNMFTQIFGAPNVFVQ